MSARDVARAHIRKSRRRPGDWRLFMVNRKGITVYSDNGFPSMAAALAAAQEYAAAYNLVSNACAGIGSWRTPVTRRPHRPDRAYGLIAAAIGVLVVAAALLLAAGLTIAHLEASL